MNITLKPEFGLSGSTMKVIAMISMVIDHIALYLMEHGTIFIQKAGTGISLLCWALP